MTDAVRARRPDPSDALWDAALAAYLPTQATKAREAAETWSTTATALLGLIAITTIFKGRETLVAVDPGFHIWILLFVAISLVAAFVTLVTASQATRGELAEGWDTPNSMREAQTNAVKYAHRWTGYSQRAVLGAFLASLIAVVLIWVAPKPASTPTNILAIGADGARACGELKVEGNRITVGGADLPSGQLSVITIEKCP